MSKRIVCISGYQHTIQKTQFEEMQDSFNEVLKEHNDNMDCSSLAKEMQKSYMKLLSEGD